MYSIGTHVSPKVEPIMNAEVIEVVHVVVDVVCGVTVRAGVFKQRAEAEACAEKIRRDRNLDEDDVQIFQCVLNEQIP